MVLKTRQNRIPFNGELALICLPDFQVYNQTIRNFLKCVFPNAVFSERLCLVSITRSSCQRTFTVWTKYISAISVLDFSEPGHNPARSCSVSSGTSNNGTIPIYVSEERNNSWPVLIVLATLIVTFRFSFRQLFRISCNLRFTITRCADTLLISPSKS